MKFFLLFFHNWNSAESASQFGTIQSLKSKMKSWNVQKHSPISTEGI